jgi:L-iditol 2-dehydrogenase
MKKQLALVKLSANADSFGLAEQNLREPGDHEVVVDVIAAGICGTDLHIVDNEYPSDPPVTLGHEVTGRVSSVGKLVDQNWIGARVVCETYKSTCEECSECRDGRRNLCAKRRSIGSMENGAFAKQLVIPARNLHRVPESISEYGAALAEPLACVCQCLLDPAVINAGDKVLVVGPGPMGVLSAQVAMAMGARVVLFGLEKDAERLKIARQIGIETTTNRPSPLSFDVVIECSGSAGGISLALESVVRTGRYVAIGISGREVTVPLDLVLYKELIITSGYATTPQSWRRALRLMESGSVNLDPMITNVLSLQDWKDAFEQLRVGSGLKVLFDPRIGG